MEEILEPDRAICDAHHHLGDRGPYHYPPAMHEDDLDSGHRIVATICVEWGWSPRSHGPEHLRPVGELERLEADPLRAGVGAAFVGGADLRLGERVVEVIEEYRRVSPRLRGVRYSTAWDARLDNHGRVAGMLREPVVREGIAVLGRFGLPLDCWVYGSQLADVVDVAGTFPEQVFVLNHIGCPLLQGCNSTTRRRVLLEWQAGMEAVAELPNVLLKIGGLGMPLLGAPWVHTPSVPPSSQDVAAYWADQVDFCVQAFEPGRCMFESNFPVDRAAVDHRTIWNAYKLLAAGRSEQDRADLFLATAARNYGLSLPGDAPETG